MRTTRREFFRRAAALTGGARLLGALLPSIERASAIDPAPDSTYLDAEHIVILMQENRSFDHVFGRLRGVRGFNDPRAVTLPDRKPVWLQTNAAGETYAPFHLDMKKSSATWLGSLPHSWRDQTDARNHGNHDQWLDAKVSGHKEYAGMPMTLGYYDREDIPFYYALADAFTVCDQHFCSSLTGTTPNRLYLWTGTIREQLEAASMPCVRNSDVDYDSPARWKTFPERLEDASVRWKIYQNELSLNTGFTKEEDSWLANFTDNPIEWFDQYNAGFLETYRHELEHRAETLPEQIEQLRNSPVPADAAEAAKRSKNLAAREAELRKVTSERPRWTPEALAKLSRLEHSLHDRAFTTNVADPFYRQLSTLRYRDGDASREMEIPKGDVLNQFRQDVETGQLPTVSWLVAPEKFSDHPSSPWYGAWYVAEALDILSRNPEVWKKTIFVLTYDENDGYFDHVPPFVAPDPDNPESGATSSGIDAGIEYLRLEQDLTRHPQRDARGGPVGLGYRVPLVVASPWSRGGFVCSQVFDHTSVLQLLEKVVSHRSGKEVRETNISAWRRTVCGDLSAAFRLFKTEASRSLTFPVKDTFLEGVHKAQFQPMPSGYRKLTAFDVEQLARDRGSVPWMPRQEPGTRPSSGLPYELYAEGAITPDSKAFEISLAASNEIFGQASAGSPFHVYTPGTFRGRIELRTRAYAVAAGHRLTDKWEIAGFEGGIYHLRVCGPNGFFREFAGSAGDPAVDIRCGYRPSGDVELHASSRLSAPCTLNIRDLAYKGGHRSMRLSAGSGNSLVLHLNRSHQWYDFSVTIAGVDRYLRRYAGRVETGKAGFSDPAMA
jgi:phospholipase C